MVEDTVFLTHVMRCQYPSGTRHCFGGSSRAPLTALQDLQIISNMTPSLQQHTHVGHMLTPATLRSWTHYLTPSKLPMLQPLILDHQTKTQELCWCVTSLKPLLRAWW